MDRDRIFPARWAAPLLIGVLCAACSGAPSTGRPSAPASIPPLAPTGTSPASASTPNPASVPPTTSPTVPARETATRSPGCDSHGAIEIGDRDLTMNVGGVDRYALVHVPPRAKRAKPLPLVVAFHSTISDPADMAWVSQLSPAADAHGFVVAYPAGLGEVSTWQPSPEGRATDDLGFTTALLDRLGGDLCLDPSRTFATGFSIGADMAMLLACRMADRFAGVGLVSAAYAPGIGDCLPQRPIPTIVFHGLLDPLVPYRGGINPLPGFEHWPPVEDVEAWARTWAAANGCSNADPADDAVIGYVTRLTWQGCKAPLVLYRIADGGHAWPGGNGFEAFGKIDRDISADELQWSFFGG